MFWACLMLPNITKGHIYHFLCPAFIKVSAPDTVLCEASNASDDAYMNKTRTEISNASLKFRISKLTQVSCNCHSLWLPSQQNVHFSYPPPLPVLLILQSVILTASCSPTKCPMGKSHARWWQEHFRLSCTNAEVPKDLLVDPSSSALTPSAAGRLPVAPPLLWKALSTIFPNAPH